MISNSGVIYDGKEVHYIEPVASKSHSAMEQDHLLMKHSDISVNINMSCANSYDQHPHDLGSFFKETNNKSNPHQKVVMLNV